MPGWSITTIGRVQGVGFRWYVRDCAWRHQITGYVRNHADGSVGMLACGTTEDLQLFTEDLKRGNRGAVVQKLEITELDNYTGYEEFVIA